MKKDKIKSLFHEISYDNFALWILITFLIILFSNDLNGWYLYKFWSIASLIAFVGAYEERHSLHKKLKFPKEYGYFEALGIYERKINDFRKVMNEYNDFLIIPKSYLPHKKEEIKESICAIIDYIAPQITLNNKTNKSNSTEWEDILSLQQEYKFLSRFIDDDIARPFAWANTNDLLKELHKPDKMDEYLEYNRLITQSFEQGNILTLEILNYISRHDVFREYSQKTRKETLELMAKC